MSNKISIPIVRKELLFPFIIITSLFALWGIANDLTNPMVSAFKKVMPELSNVQASLVQFAFYFGYFFMEKFRKKFVFFYGKPKNPSKNTFHSSTFHHI